MSRSELVGNGPQGRFGIAAMALMLFFACGLISLVRIRKKFKK
jgi:hypothetical protein